MQQQEDNGAPLNVFISYAHEDEPLRDELEKHLALLQRRELIATWHDRQVVPGMDWSQEIDHHLNTASLILLLISPDFLASDYCYGIEMERALARHQAGDARVIPIILRPVDWQGQGAPFAVLQCLPHDARPVTSWPNRDEAWLDVVKGIRRAVEELRNSSARKRSRLAPAFNRQNRERLLKRMRVYWIEGVLEESLHKAALIALGLQEQPDALANPWRLELQESNRPARPLPAGTRITQVYDHAGGGLLILGEPGAGKTTLLLELARDLLTRAEQVDSLPMPVMFNLSSWAEKRLSLQDWLVEELDIKYQVPRKLGRMWVGQGRILPLLDGLDEVREEARPVCIAAINAYYLLHQDVPLVVCSRIKEYFAQDRRVAFLKAVSIQPLTTEQIDAYLTSAGGQLEAVREALRTNAALQELVTTPLMLNVLTLTYQGSPLDELQSAGTREAQQQLIFATYVDRMFKRRRSDPRFPEQQTIHWLSWLARQMARHSQSTFFIERMQPDWLPDRQARRGYSIIVRLLIVLPLVALNLPVGLITLPFWDAFANSQPALYTHNTFYEYYRPFSPFISGVVVFVTWLIVALIGTRGKEIKPAEHVSWSWKKVAKILGIILAIIWSILLAFYLAIFLAIFLFSILQVGLPTLTTQSWVFLIFWIILTVNGIILIVSVMSVAMLFFVGPYALPFGFTASVVEKNIFLRPNEGIRRSARHSMRYGIIVLLLSGFYLGLFFWLFFALIFLGSQASVIASIKSADDFFKVLLGELLKTLPIGLVSALSSGLFFGLIVALFTGGIACIQHGVLRWLLWRAKSIPWNLPQFLDYAAERILLRKVGGGYSFIHRLLLDYFASLEATPIVHDGSK